MSPFFCFWNPESPRAVSFTGAALERQGEWPRSMAWADYLQDAPLPEASPEMIVRIDSPGRNWAVEKLLLSRVTARIAEQGLDSLSRKEVDALQDDPGRVIASRQCYLGFRDGLDHLQRHFESGGVRWMQHPEDIAVMCDKAACHARLAAAGIRVPEALGLVGGFDDLMARMDAAGRNRVFLKLCHGSSASGTVALERSAGRMQAFSTAKMSDGVNGVVLHNWRAVTRYEDQREIRRLVDAVCRHRAVAEVWMPKAGWRGRRFDVRIVVIGGRARQVVARLAEGPFTNLQFGALRASAEELRAHIGEDSFTAMCIEAERAMACFPRSLYGGVDVLLDARRHRAHILEVNAFGDLLPSVRHEGRSTYDWEITQMLERGQVSTTGM